MVVGMGYTLVLLGLLFMVLAMGLCVVVVEDFQRVKEKREEEVALQQEIMNLECLDIISMEIDDELDFYYTDKPVEEGTEYGEDTAQAAGSVIEKEDERAEDEKRYFDQKTMCRKP